MPLLELLGAAGAAKLAFASHHASSVAVRPLKAHALGAGRSRAAWRRGVSRSLQSLHVKVASIAGTLRALLRWCGRRGVWRRPTSYIRIRNLNRARLARAAKLRAARARVAALRRQFAMLRRSAQNYSRTARRYRAKALHWRQARVGAARAHAHRLRQAARRQWRKPVSLGQYKGALNVRAGLLRWQKFWKRIEASPKRPRWGPYSHPSRALYRIRQRLSAVNRIVRRYKSERQAAARARAVLRITSKYTRQEQSCNRTAKHYEALARRQFAKMRRCGAQLRAAKRAVGKSRAARAQLLRQASALRKRAHSLRRQAKHYSYLARRARGSLARCLHYVRVYAARCRHWRARAKAAAAKAAKARGSSSAVAAAKNNYTSAVGRLKHAMSYWGYYKSRGMGNAPFAQNFRKMAEQAAKQVRHYRELWKRLNRTSSSASKTAARNAWRQVRANAHAKAQYARRAAQARRQIAHYVRLARSKSAAARRLFAAAARVVRRARA